MVKRKKSNISQEEEMFVDSVSSFVFDEEDESTYKELESEEIKELEEEGSKDEEKDVDELWNELVSSQNEREQKKRESRENKTASLNTYNHYVKTIREYKVLPSDEINDLFRIMNESDNPEQVESAREKIILHNLRFVITVTKKYLNQGVDSMDLIQEGTRGLMSAVEKFDYKKGFKFSTYSVWWIKQAAQRAIQNHSRSIRLPVHIRDLLSKINRATRELTEELEREPTDKEIADYLAIDKVTEKTIKETKFRTMEIVSMDAPLKPSQKDGETTTSATFIGDEYMDTPEDVVNQNILHEELFKVFEDVLNQDEILVLIHKYGLNGEIKKTNQEVAEIIKVSKEKVRKLEAEAINKVKSSDKIEELREFLYKQ